MRKRKGNKGKKGKSEIDVKGSGKSTNLYVCTKFSFSQLTYLPLLGTSLLKVNLLNQLQKQSPKSANVCVNSIQYYLCAVFPFYCTNMISLRTTCICSGRSNGNGRTDQVII